MALQENNLVDLHELPRKPFPGARDFQQNHDYTKDTIIFHTNTLYRARINFISGGSFNISDWEQITNDYILVRDKIDYLDNRMTDEEEARQLEDIRLQTNINTEALTRQQAIQAEETARKKRDVEITDSLINQIINSNNADQLLASKIANEASARSQGDNELHSRIDGVENLGHYVGAYDTYAQLPKNNSGFLQGITVNDFTTIRTDETRSGATTRYIVSSIASNGVIKWTYDVTYSTDISGKADKVAGAINGNFAGLNASGNLTNSGKEAADFATAAQGTKADTAYQKPSNGIPYSDMAQDVQGALNNANSAIQFADKGVPGGVASLDNFGKVPEEQLPDNIGGGSDDVETFTFVIDSDAALEAWATNAPGNDYSRILIRAGTWTYIMPDFSNNAPGQISTGAVIDISDGRTLSVVGEAGNLISIQYSHTIDNNHNISIIKGVVNNPSMFINIYSNEQDHFYLNKLKGHFIRNVNIRLDITNNTGYQFICNGFSNCFNVMNCSITQNDFNTGLYIHGFSTCMNLTNCLSIIGKGSSYSTCSNLTNCLAKTSENGFYNCNFLTNCSGLGSFGSYVFSLSSYLTNCSAKINSSGTALSVAFGSCDYLTNCNARVVSVGKVYGFSACSNLTNCKSEVSSKTIQNNINVFAFSTCMNLTNCQGISTVTGYGGTTYGFSECRTGFGCLGVLNSSIFYNCYMEQSAGSTQWDNTAAGGYNNIRP